MPQPFQLVAISQKSQPSSPKHISTSKPRSSEKKGKKREGKGGGQRTSHHRRSRTPTRIPHTSLPHMLRRPMLQFIHIPGITPAWSRMPCGFRHINRRLHRSIEVIDPHLPVFRSTIHVSRIRACGRGEVAADKCFEDRVSAESDDTAVIGVGRVVVCVVGGEAVVESTGVLVEVHS
jgi:hypothetical protein